MAEALNQVKTLQEKRARKGEIANRCNAILWIDGDKNKGPREYNADEGNEFERLAVEHKALKAEIDADNGRLTRQQLAMDMLLDADKPENQALAHRQNPDVEAARQKDDDDFARGRYTLRHFPNKDGHGHARAYEAGLALLGRGDYGNPCRQWASRKAREFRGSLSRYRASDGGLDIEKLAPFAGEDANAAGGYLVPPEFEATIIILRELYGVAQREFFKMPMASDTLQVPRRAGGTTVYYPGENSQLTESAMQFSQLTLTAKKYAQMTRWSTELSEDSVISIADLLAGECAYQFTKAEDLNGFNGDGTSTYGGVTGIIYKLLNTTGGLSNAASLVAAAATHTTVGTTTLADWNKIVGLLPLYADARAKWYMHKSVFFGGIVPLLEASGGGNIANLMIDGYPKMFLGAPVVFTQAMVNSATALGSGNGVGTVISVPALYGDMNVTGYMGMRRGVTTRTSWERYLEYDQVALQVTERVAINAAVGDSVAPATVPGPMLGLQLPSS
jgi:HK97 family phage major capsid protein